MPILATDGDTGQRERPTPGMVDAICVFVVDVGRHLVKTAWGDKIQHKVVFVWEIDELLQSGEYKGKPFMVSQRFTLTLFEKANLAKTIESWFSKKIPDEKRKTGIDLESFVGKKCTLNLIESDDGKYINVGAVLPASKTNAMVPVCTVIPEWITKLQAAQIKVVATDRQPGQDADEPPIQEPPPDFGNQDSLPF